MFINFSKHGYERLERVSSLLSRREVIGAVQAAARKAGGKFAVGETAIKVKCLPSIIGVDGADGSVSYGDTVYVVYKRGSLSDVGVVATVELRFASQGPSKRWVKVIDVCE